MSEFVDYLQGSLLFSSANLPKWPYVLLTVFFKNDFLETNYLRIYLTDYYDFSPICTYSCGLGPIFSIPQDTLPWQPIVGQILGTKVHSAQGVRKPIAILPFRLKNIRLQHCSYILCKFQICRVQSMIANDHFQSIGIVCLSVIRGRSTCRA